MRPLSAQTILQIWEIGQHQHPIDRALTLLSFAFPDRSLEELACLSIGQRDRGLLTLREVTFGSQLAGMAECPHCGERLEFEMAVADVLVDKPAPNERILSETAIPAIATPAIAFAETNLTLEGFELEGFELTVRLPDSRDLAAIAHCPDLETAHRLLAQRCLRQVNQAGVALEAASLPPAILSQVADRLAGLDPQAEIWLDFTCPACQQSWQLLFDIVTFFWTELSAQAIRLMREVHTLARFYGWREADILAMSSARRQAYLEMVG